MDRQSNTCYYQNQLSYLLCMSMLFLIFISSLPEVLLGKGVLKMCSKFTGQSSQSVISIKLLCKFLEVALRH